LYEPYCSVANKILIDYKAFKEAIATKMRNIDINFSLPTTALTSNKQTPAAAAQHFQTMNSDYDTHANTTAKHHRQNSEQRGSSTEKKQRMLEKQLMQ